MHAGVTLDVLRDGVDQQAFLVDCGHPGKRRLQHMLVHRWDLARAVGSDVRFTDAELDRIEKSVEGFGEHLYSDGDCGPPVDVPSDAPRQQRLLGRWLRRAARPRLETD